MTAAPSSARGWGPGWPAGVPASQLVQVDVAGVRYPGGVRREIAELVAILTAETMRRGYVFGVPGNPAHGCWGYSNRPIAGTQTASNHSWGLAVDINAPRNPMTSPPARTDMPPWMPALWESYRFAWGGRWQNRPDPMHYEYMGTPAQAAADTDRARAELGAPTPAPEDDDMGFTCNDAEGQTWHCAGVWRTPISWDTANALAGLAKPVPFLGAMPADALAGYAVAT